jgi:hypothetical protein
MNAAPLTVFQDGMLEDPRALLTGSQITHLRKLDRFGVAIKVPNGWVCGGAFHRYEAFKPFVRLNLADETYFDGHKLRLNARGRTVIALLAERRRKPKAG